MSGASFLSQDKSVDEFKISFNDLLKYAVNNIDMETNPERTSEFLDKLDEVISKLGFIEANFVPYDAIATVVFSLEVDSQSMEMIDRVMSAQLVEHIESEDYSKDLETKVIKMMSNVRLASAQMDFLYKKQKEDIANLSSKTETLENNLNDKAKELTNNIEQTTQKKMNEITTEFTNQTEQLNEQSKDAIKEMNTRINGMYSSFISVLGIFVTISFSLFGAATLLNNIFNAKRNVGENIMLSGVACILIYLLVVGLIVGLRSMTGREISRKTLVADVSLWIILVASGVSFAGFIYGHSNFDWIHAISATSLLLLYVCITSWAYKKFHSKYNVPTNDKTKVK